jgi:subtilisin family serine protease
MRKILVAVLVFLPFSGTFAGMPKHPRPVHREGEVLVTYRDDAAAAQAVQLKSGLALSTKRRLQGGRLELLGVPSYMTLDNAIALLRQDPAVAHARPNFLRVPRQMTPDDTLFPQLWGLHNTGQPNFVAGGPAGDPGADMDMLAAWDPNGDGVFDRVGDGTVTIAIIDDSFFTTHEDLAANFVAGYDFENMDSNPSPGSGEQHGTFVAGAAGAIGNNGKGVAGTAWNVKLMPLKFGFDVAGHIAAIEFARSNGADIINASFGGPGFDQAEEDAIAALADVDDILYVAAAGNDDSNTDIAQLNYPANLDAPNIVAVAATNRQDGIASFSQYGPMTTDVAAPGLQIVTTANGVSTYATAGVSGTSFSSPYTAGIAALIRSEYPTADYGEVRARLIEGAEAVNDTTLRTAGGRVNAANSLDLAARPALVIESIDWVDANDRLDPGEPLAVDITLRNLWQDATDISGTLTADNGVTVTSGPVSFAATPGGSTATARFDLNVEADVTEHRYVHFTLALTAAGGYAATRGFIAEIGRLATDQIVTQTFAPRDVDLYDEFHAWHYDFTGLPAGHTQLVIETTSTAAGVTSPDIDLLVKLGVPPQYSITVGINPETDSGFFCTSGTTGNCQDPATRISAGADGNERVVITNPTAGTYHIVIVNFAQLTNGLTYTLRAYTRAAPPPSRSGGGGGLPLSALALFALAALGRRLLRAA